MTDQSTSATDREPQPSVHGVVLAAGTSSRYGEANKLLEPIDGDPLVVHAVRTICASSVDGTTVVVGYEAERVRGVLADLPVDVRVNHAFESGQSTSVATGVAAARERGADAVVFALGDMPDVAVQSVETLLGAYRSGEGDALAAAYEGIRGNPVLFDSRFFDALTNVDGDVGGREILRTDPAAAVSETGDPGVLRDIDHPADLRGRNGGA